MGAPPSPPFAFDFRIRPVSPPLSRFVESIWYARGRVPYAREKIAPTGSSVAVIVLGDPILQVPGNGQGVPFRAERGFLVGPHDRPAVNEPVGETFAVGVVATPVGCEAVFGVPPARLRGRVVDLESAWPAAASLRAALLRDPNPERMLALVEQHLGATVSRDPAAVERCALAVARLEVTPTRPIAAIAAEVGVSHGHLDREFTRLVGLTPRVLARLLRMRRLLAALDVSASIGWTDLAQQHGWFDQAHLIRDFKRHTGVTPSAYVAAQRTHLTPAAAGESAGFVPEP
jgi:AraC-like DNA-binding protein